jgi:hypothetical protein
VGLMPHNVLYDTSGIRAVKSRLPQLERIAKSELSTEVGHEPAIPG